jgi:hypothetical protein
MMHTKLIRIKWEMFCIILQVAGVDQGQVGGTRCASSGTWDGSRWP